MNIPALWDKYYYFYQLYRLRSWNTENFWKPLLCVQTSALFRPEEKGNKKSLWPLPLGSFCLWIESRSQSSFLYLVRNPVSQISFPVLLKYSWHIKIYVFKALNMMVCYVNISTIKLINTSIWRNPENVNWKYATLVCWLLQCEWNHRSTEIFLQFLILDFSIRLIRLSEVNTQQEEEIRIAQLVQTTSWLFTWRLTSLSITLTLARVHGDGYYKKSAWIVKDFL